MKIIKTKYSDYALSIEEMYIIKEVIVKDDDFDTKDTLTIIKYADDEYLIMPIFKAVKVIDKKTFKKLTNYFSCNNEIKSFLLQNLKENYNALIINDVADLEIENAKLNVLIHRTDEAYNNFYEKFYNNEKLCNEEQLEAIESYNFRMKRHREAY